MTRRFVHTAMATRFDMWLCGTDEQLLVDVAQEVWREVDRLELLMSRHDQRAEIARINREARERAVRIEIELFEILEDCRRWFEATNGYFDVTATLDRSASDGLPQPFALDPERRTVRITTANVRFDLGGYGKGYALDRILTLLDRFEMITSGYIQAGTSSVLASGVRENGEPWSVAMPAHFRSENASKKLQLMDQGFSYSGVYHAGESEASDIIDPYTGRRLDEPAACWVIAPDALEAEVLSTALLAMGRQRAGLFMRQYVGESVDRLPGSSRLNYFIE